MPLGDINTAFDLMHEGKSMAWCISSHARSEALVPIERIVFLEYLLHRVNGHGFELAARATYRRL